jgi:hypothetical protein
MIQQHLKEDIPEVLTYMVKSSMELDIDLITEEEV